MDGMVTVYIYASGNLCPGLVSRGTASGRQSSLESSLPPPPPPSCPRRASPCSPRDVTARLGAVMPSSSLPPPPSSSAVLRRRRPLLAAGLLLLRGNRLCGATAAAVGASGGRVRCRLARLVVVGMMGCTETELEVVGKAGGRREGGPFPWPRALFRLSINDQST